MNFIVFDLEATCWKGFYPNTFQEIIEIGALKVNPFGEIIGKFDTLVKPVINPTLSAYCTELTNIEQSDVNRADKFEKEIERFKDWIGYYDDENYQLCSWGNFDKKLLINNCERFDLETDWIQNFFDIRRQYLNIRPHHRPIGLKRALEREGFEFEGDAHRAFYDAWNLVKLFNLYLDEWQF